MTEGRIVLRASAYAELHLWLAASARTDADVGAELEAAKRSYRRALEGDDDDALLDRTTRALAACSDDRCAGAAVASTSLGGAFAEALPIFVRQRWLDRARWAWLGVEAARAVMDPVAEALLARAGSALHVAWPDHVAIDVVAEAPPEGKAALFPRALAARGRCFARDREEEGRRLRDARILDCLIVRALIDPEVRSPIRQTLTERLGARDGERAWALLAVHVASSVVRGWTPKHVSVDRRSVESVEAPRLAWLAKGWPVADDAAGAQAAEAFAASWRETGDATAR